MRIFRYHKSTTTTTKATRGEGSAVRSAVKAVKANAVIENARKSEPCGAIEMEMEMKMKLSRVRSPSNPHTYSRLLAFLPAPNSAYVMRCVSLLDASLVLSARTFKVCSCLRRLVMRAVMRDATRGSASK